MFDEHCRDALLWFVQVQNRTTGRLVGQPERFASSGEASARMHCLEMETQVERFDVCCWLG
jgi:hypothetical protein